MLLAWPCVLLAACSSSSSTDEADSSVSAGDSTVDGPDDDDDGVQNSSDNCPDDANPDQEDTDKDGVGDACDNCVPLPNHDQEDSDDDGVGDVCEDALLPDGDNDDDGIPNKDDLCPTDADETNADTDKDGIGDVCDNCPKVANSDQADDDDDGIGDVCDDDTPPPDSDGDGVPDDKDNCPGFDTSNTDDLDKDGVGDLCDNCPMISNYKQKDSDGDGTGDACQAGSGPDPNADDDGDGVPNKDDKCPDVASSDNTDSDNDGWGDACDNCKNVANSDQNAKLSATDKLRCDAGAAVDPDGDADGDGVPNKDDKCPATTAGQPIAADKQTTDTDGDGWGDGCDNCPKVANYSQDVSACALPDGDGDGRPDSMDNCRAVANADQADADGDGVGDVCDNCPNTANVNQKDSDGDGNGDACDPSPGTFTVCAQATTAANAIKPDLYFLIDRSLSMVPPRLGGDGPSDRLGSLKTALAMLANQSPLATNFNLGVGAFPGVGGSCNANDVPQQVLAMGAHDAGQFTAAVNSIAAVGYTPTDVALQRVLSQRLFDFAGDPSPNGPKAIVLVTDGVPNDCTTSEPNRIDQTVAAAASVAAAGVPVYLLGFDDVDQGLMQRIADAGDPAPGTNVWYNVTNTQSIVNAFNAIITRTASCTLGLMNTGSTAFDPNIITVEFVRNNGASRSVVPRDATNGYTISGTTITLAGTACSSLQSAVASDASARIEIKAGCQCVSSGMETCGDNMDNDCDGLIDEDCIPTNTCGVDAPPKDCPPMKPPAGPPEICDGIDNDGDNQVDEGCPGKCMSVTDEVCDGADNDCDGQVDDGCPPACMPNDEICDGIDNDCDGVVDEGCGDVCRPLTEICDDKDNDCDGEVDEICPTDTVLN